MLKFCSLAALVVPVLPVLADVKVVTLGGNEVTFTKGTNKGQVMKITDLQHRLAEKYVPGYDATRPAAFLDAECVQLTQTWPRPVNYDRQNSGDKDTEIEDGDSEFTMVVVSPDPGPPPPLLHRHKLHRHGYLGA